MKLVYFAWLRDRLGRSEEEVTPPAEVTTVAGLLEWLKARDAVFAEILAQPERLRVAVNQEYAGSDAPVKHGDEVAIFPPVTGG